MPNEKAALVSYFGDRAAVQEMEINRGNEKKSEAARTAIRKKGVHHFIRQKLMFER